MTHTTTQDALRSLVAKWREDATTERDYYADALRACANQLEAALSPPQDAVRSLPDVVIACLQRYGGFDSWWGDIDEDDSDVILRDLEEKLRAALSPAPERVEVTDEMVERGTRVAWGNQPRDPCGNAYAKRHSQDSGRRAESADGNIHRRHEERTMTDKNDWVLAPREPDETMLEAALRLHGEDALLARSPALLSALLKIYRAMLAAAPQPKDADGGCRMTTRGNPVTHTTTQDDKGALIVRLNAANEHLIGAAEHHAAIVDAITALSPAPERVDEAMVERAYEAYRNHLKTDGYMPRAMKAALTAAMRNDHE